MDLSQQIESDQRRLQDRSQIAHLQGQLDDLRHQLEQQSARAQLANEQARQIQDVFSQLEARFQAMAGENKLQEQTRLRTMQALQKEVAEIRVRVEEPARQILTLAAQVQDIQEVLRLLREQAGQGQEAGKELEQRMEELRAQGLLREERLARLDALLGQLRQGEEERQQSVRHVRDEIESERQGLRRQVADIERLAADLRGEGQEFISRLNRQAELQRQTAATIESLGQHIESMRPQFDRLAGDLQRTERESVERTLQGQERLESLRQNIQREGEELREAEERRGESQNAWLRRIEELYHGLDERLMRRDDETSQKLAQLEVRVDAVDKGLEKLMRSLMDLFQEQLEKGAEERLRHIEPAGED